MITHLPRLQVVPVPDNNRDRLSAYYAKRVWVDGVTHCYQFRWIRKLQNDARGGSAARVGCSRCDPGALQPCGPDCAHITGAASPYARQESEE